MSALRTITVAATVSAIAATVSPRDSRLETRHSIDVDPIAAPRFPIPPESETADSTHFSFIAYGDTRDAEDGQIPQFVHSLVVQTMLDSIASRASSGDAIRFVLQSGDAVSNGTQVAQWNVSFVPIVNRLTTEAGIPYFLTPGNHDLPSFSGLRDANRNVGLTNYFHAVARTIPSNGDARRLKDYPAFAFGYGNTFVITFDSNIADDRKQFDWVEDQLEHLDHARYTNIVVFFHHPVFSSGPHGFPRAEPSTLQLRSRWMPLFHRYHVRLLLAGHDHLYEHWTEHYVDASGVHRLDQIVSAGGGAPLYNYRGEPDVSGYLRANAADSLRLDHVIKPSADPAGNPYHFVIVHVDGTHLSLEVVGVAGGSNFRPYGDARVSLDDHP
jgi:hypothetical protein